MNKIYRKVADFGILPRFKNIPLDRITETAKMMIASNLPLCLIDLKEENALIKLREVAFKADLFLAAENPSSLNEAFEAAGNGAQFFICDDYNPELMQQLKNAGLFAIPKITTKEEALKANEMFLEAVLTEDKSLLEGTGLKAILEEPHNTPSQLKDSAFIISDFDGSESPDLWADKKIMEMLNLRYTEVLLKKEEEEEIITTGEVFAATHKIPVKEGETSALILSSSDITRALKYFKWKSMYINPNTAEMEGPLVKRAVFDKKIGGLSVMIMREDS